MPQVNFRMSSERLAVIDRAAAIRGVSRTEFVLRSSEAAAIEILNERPVIALDDDAWDDFIAALDAPVEIDPAVKARYPSSTRCWTCELRSLTLPGFGGQGRPGFAARSPRETAESVVERAPAPRVPAR